MENRIQMIHKDFIRVPERCNREKSGRNMLKDNGWEFIRSGERHQSSDQESLMKSVIGKY